MAQSQYRVGSKIQWKWLGRPVLGVIKEVHHKPVTKTIKGKKITRKGSTEIPAYLVQSEAGNLALKLATELSTSSSKAAKTKKSKPTLFNKSHE